MLEKQEIDLLINEFSPMGFDPQEIIMAWLQSNKRKALTLDILLTKAEKNKLEVSISRKAIDRLSSTQIFEREIQKAIKMSAEETENVIKPDQLLRNNFIPVGLKNVGNTCYFNSLIQTVFQVKELVYTILNYEPPKDIEKYISDLDITDSDIIKRKKGSSKLVLELQKLFALMLFGKKNVVNPEAVINSMIDSQGNLVTVGEQFDITEFSNNFFERIEEGLSINNKKEEEQKEFINNFQGLFFGKSKDFITFEWAEVTSKKEQDSVFGPINININEKDLMSGLDAFTNFIVDGYRSPNGDITAAKKRIWITKPPKILTFVLQRVIYDKEKGLQKQTNPFYFQKEIYLDRFLFENKKALKHPHDEKKSLKIREKKIDASIQKLKDFKDCRLGVVDILDYANKYFQEQLGELEKDYVDVNSDSADERIDDIVDKNEMKKIVESINKYKTRVQGTLNQLEAKKNHIKKKIETSYNEHKSLKYNLHSIVVHEGGANGGHYYSFIYDNKSQKWTKFNDSIISEASEEEVNKLATGGSHKSACAYCLFYAQEGCEVIEFSSQYIESMKSTLNSNLSSFIEKENAKFMTEYQHFNSNMIQSINDDYLVKMSSLSYETAKFQNEFK